MFIEKHAKQLVSYCAEVTRILGDEVNQHHDMWTPVLDYINEQLPRGSGFNKGSMLSIDESKQGRLVFVTAFHHMDEFGSYDGWTDHMVIVTPTFDGFSIRVTGRDKNQIKDYIAECFHGVLSEYVKTEFDSESRTMTLKPAQYDYGFNGPIPRKES